MKTKQLFSRSRSWFLVLAATLLGYLAEEKTLASDPIVLQFKPAGSQGEVGLRSMMALPVSAMYAEYTILRSTNMQTWEPVAGPLRG